MHTSVCIGAVLMMDVSALAQGKTNLHPDIGAKPPKELLASDILALPEREKQAWIHGAISLTAQTMAKFDQDRAGCIIGWYFESNGKSVILKALSAYSDRPATSIVIAAATNVCS